MAASLLLFGQGLRQPNVDFSKRPSLIFNQISDADTHQGSLKRCVELCAQLPIPVINRPESVLRTTRDKVSELLQGIPGVQVPKTVRFRPESPDSVLELSESAGIPFPFIVRIAGRHGGTSSRLFDSPESLGALHAYPFDGRDFYLTEYVDCRDEAGFYNRQRLIVIDGEPVLRGSLYDRNWMVHGASRNFMLSRETWEDDRIRAERLEQEVIPRLVPAIQEITWRLKLDLYGIDCHLGPDGSMLLFEANANMNVLTNSHPEMNARMKMIENRIQTMLANHSGERVI